MVPAIARLSKEASHWKPLKWASHVNPYKEILMWSSSKGISQVKPLIESLSYLASYVLNFLWSAFNVEPLIRSLSCETSQQNSLMLSLPLGVISCEASQGDPPLQCGTSYVDLAISRGSYNVYHMVPLNRILPCGISYLKPPPLWSFSCRPSHFKHLNEDPLMWNISCKSSPPPFPYIKPLKTIKPCRISH